MARRGGPDALEVALQHLCSADAPLYGDRHQQQQQDQVQPWARSHGVEDWEHQPPLSTAAASGMHRVSRRYRAIARSTRAYAALDTYLRHKQCGISSSGQHAYHPLEDTDPALLPWGYLGEATALTAVSLELCQVPLLLAGPPGLLQDLTGRLRALRVFGMCADSSQDQLLGLGRMLAQCTGLQVLHASGSLRLWDQQPLQDALLAGINSSSSSAAGGPNSSMQLSSHNSCRDAAEAVVVEGQATTPTSSSSSACLTQGRQGPLPLLELSTFDLALAPFAAWLQQRGQAGQLRSLALHSWQKSDFKQDMQCLTGLTGLQKLWLEPSGCIDTLEWGLGGMARAPQLPESLAALSSSLTQLSVKGGLSLTPDAANTLGALTQLRHLELRNCKVSGEVSADRLTALRRLTHLDLSGTPLSPLPRQLGRSLPDLEVLMLGGCSLGSLPRGLTRLTRLHAPSDSDERFNMDVAALSQATALRELDLSGRDIVNPSTFLSALSQLEVLVLKEAGGRALPEYNGEGAEEDEEDSGWWSEEEEEEGWEEEEEWPEEEVWEDEDEPHQRYHHYWHHQQQHQQHQQQQLEDEEEGAWSDEQEEPGDEGSEGSSAEDGRRRPAPQPALLPPLPRLRHLDLSDGRWWVYDLAALGGLKHLTYLNLSGALATRGDEGDVGALPALGVLPALKQLSLERNHIDSHQWPAVGAWLGRQPQLTRLSLQRTKRLYWDVDPQQQALGLAQLPTQLVELDLTYCKLQRLPRRLSQMTNLRVLLVGVGNPDLPPRVPSWLPALQALDTLQLQPFKDPAGVELLAQLPQLKRLGAYSSEENRHGLSPALTQRLARRLPHVNLQLGWDYTVEFFPCRLEDWHDCHDMD